MSEEGNVIAEKDPPTPRKRVAGVSAETSAEVDEIVNHLNSVTGRGFGKEKANEQIIRVIKAGATVAECKLVIDHLWETWSPEWRKRIDKTTPFRKANFDRYLDAARAGSVKEVRLAPKPAEDDDPDLTAAEREAARAALANLGLGGMCNWT